MLIKKTLTIILFCFCSLVFLSYHTYANPLLSKSSSVQKNQAPLVKTGLTKKILRITSPVQRKLNRTIATLMRDIKDQKRSALFILLLISFLYGIIHSLGPGHGKLITSSFFLSREAKVSDGLITGFMIAATHAFSALLLVLILYMALNNPITLSITSSTNIIRPVSAVLIVITGLFILFKTIYGFHHTHKYSIEINEQQNIIKTLLPISLATGMVPCPGAIAILIFSLSAGTLATGILAVFSMSIGMAIMISFFCLFTIILKKTFVNNFLKESRFKNIIKSSLQTTGALLIISTGIAMLFL